MTSRRDLIVGGAALALAGATRADAADDGPLPEDGYYEVIETLHSTRLWSIRQGKPFHLQPIGNVTVIDQADGLVVVDAGGSPGSGRRIVSLIQGVSRKPVKAIVITHWHGDHPLGLSELLKVWPDARTIAHEATRAHLANPRTMNTPGAPDPAANARMLARYRGFAGYCGEQAAAATDPVEMAGWQAGHRLFNQYVRDMDGALTLAPKEGFADRLVIDDPDQPVEVLHLGRANTDGDALVWLPRQRCLIAGDVVVSPIPFGFGSYPAEWLAVIRRILAMDVGTFVPGHGAPMSDNRYLIKVGAALQHAQAQVRALPARTSLEGAKSLLDDDRYARLFVGDDPWLRRWFKAYWSDPILVSAWKEANGVPIVQGLEG